MLNNILDLEADKQLKAPLVKQSINQVINVHKGALLSHPKMTKPFLETLLGRYKEKIPKGLAIDQLVVAAVAHGENTTIKLFLDKNTTKQLAENLVYNMILMAVKNNHTQMLDIFVEKDLNMNANLNGNTVLHTLAKTSNRPNYVEGLRVTQTYSIGCKSKYKRLSKPYSSPLGV